MTLPCDAVELQHIPWLPPPTSTYLQHPDRVAALYMWPPTIEGVREALPDIDKRSYKRRLLAHTIRSQYEQTGPQLLKDYPAVSGALHELQDPGSIVVTGGQQIHLWGGPLYVAAKISTIIATARALREVLHRPVIPVFWMHTEDHDYEEIRCVRYAGRNYCSPYVPDKPFPVGTLPAEAGRRLERELPPQVRQSFPYFSVFSEAYHTSRTLTEATRRWITHLWGREGLLVIDPADPALKEEAHALFEAELQHRAVSRSVQAVHEQHGRQWQRHFIPPRPVNLFYLHPEQGRLRIEPSNGRFRVGPHSFTAAELLKQSDRLSPNVLMRPLYQQTILPAVATILGPAEISYWLQLKAAFQRTHTFFPQLVARHWFAYVPASLWQWWQQQSLPHSLLFAPPDAAETQWLESRMPDLLAWHHQTLALLEAHEPAILSAFSNSPGEYWKWKKQLLKHHKKLIQKARKNIREHQQESLSLLHQLLACIGYKKDFQDRRLSLLAIGKEWPTHALSEMISRAEPYHPAAIICPA